METRLLRASLQRVGEIEPTGLHRGYESDRHAGRDGERQRDDEHTAIDRRSCPTHVWQERSANQPAAPVREDYGSDASRQRQEYALGHQQPNETPATDPDRQSDRHLASAPSRA